jgi:adenylyl-sulfate kinase
MSGFIVWFTGMPCSGKSTLALELAARLVYKLNVEILDGDDVRTTLSQGLGFSKEDRFVQASRVGYVSRLLARNGVGVIAATVSPYAEARRLARIAAEIEHIPFVEVHTRADIATLVERDVKGLYKKAIAGEIKNFTGISDPFEAPLDPDVEVLTGEHTVPECADKVMDFLRSHAIIGAR